MRSKEESFHKSDQGVSSVLGALLIIALLVNFMVLVRVEFVPIWEADVEAQHLHDAERDMTYLASALLSGTGNSYRSEPIALSPTTLVNFGPNRFPARLVMSTEMGGLGISSDSFMVVAQSSGRAGSTYGAVPQKLGWTSVDDQNSISDIGRLLELRFRLSEMTVEDAPSSFSAVWTNTANQVVANLTASIEPSEQLIQVSVVSRDADGNVMGSRIDDVEEGALGITYYLNALDEIFRVGQTLSSSSGPFTLSMNHDSGIVTNPLSPVLGGPQLHFATTYENGQGVILGSGGQAQTNFQLAVNASRFLYDYPTRFAKDRDYVLEYGGLVQVQPDGAIIKSGPGFFLGKSGPSLVMKMDVPSSSNPGTAASSSATTLVGLTPNNQSVLVGFSNQLELRWKTKYAAAWADHWKWDLQAAGFGDGRGNLPGIQITTNPTDLLVTLTGSAAGSDASFDRIILNLANPVFGVDIE
jgi:hypothetical protein